ncbi:hypothetical protein [Spirosoma fluviale]|uniref:Uncharacterized protein n=1 Tax=Spirosoma fluviale TaxID=1597977 RepID=A0A286GBD8_9BACT|nr:hypothetical protein [Spirosoma fluviale]SOD92449.1 hypothetical protein SAMN06269250_3984 [Spirosoma fluviale]
MRNTIALFAAASCLFFSSCQRPVAYFQPTAHPAATRLPVKKVAEQERAPTDVAPTDVAPTDVAALDIESENEQAIIEVLTPESGQTASQSVASSSVLASRTAQSHQTTASRIEHHMQRVNTLLSTPETQPTDQQPGPKPKKKLKLGNQIRQGLGMKLRPELNWWQRISWKLKASVFVILVAVVFAILGITILAIIFGVLGAFLMISGLKKSFKVRRPWF